MTRCFGKIYLYVLGLFVTTLVGAYMTNLVIEHVGVSFFAEWSRYLTFLYGALIAIVIQLITKTNSLGDLEGLKAKQHFKAAQIVKEKSYRLWVLAGFYLFAATASLLLPLAIKLGDSWGYWGAFVISMALVLSLYFAARIPVWFEELREFMWNVQGQMKLEKERQELAEELHGHAKDFKPDDKLDGSKRVCH